MCEVGAAAGKEVEAPEEEMEIDPETGQPKQPPEEPPLLTNDPANPAAMQ